MGFLRGFAVVLSFAALVGVAQASCPNKCSGHGECLPRDECKCWSNWQGNDCSLRTCHSGRAWVDVAGASGDAHKYAECSNRGICDRATGLCECQEGYTGDGCARTACPNDCSGHGTCETIAELASDDSKAAGGASFLKYNDWDASQSRGCKCDARFSGLDCATRMCPRGDDPLTANIDNTQATSTSLQSVEVQNVTVQSVSSLINGGEVTFTYTDLYNGVWTTRPVTLPDAFTYTNLKSQLRGMPFMWRPVANMRATAGQATTITFDEKVPSSFGAVTATGVAVGTTADITVNNGKTAGFALGDLAIVSNVLTSEYNGYAQDNVVQLTTKVTQTVITATRASGATVTTVAGMTATPTFTKVMGLNKVDIYDQKDSARYSTQRTVQLDSYFTTGQAAAMRQGDQVLLSSATGTSRCLMTLAGDQARTNLITGVADVSVAATATLGAHDADGCRPLTFGSVIGITTSEVATFNAPHTLNVGDEITFMDLDAGGAGLTNGDVYSVKTVPTTTTITLAASGDAELTSSYVRGEVAALAAVVSTAYTAANMTIVGRKVTSIDDTTDGLATFPTAHHTHVGAHLWMYSMAGTAAGSAPGLVMGSAALAAMSAAPPTPLVVEALESATTALLQVTGDYTTAGGGDAMVLTTAWGASKHLVGIPLHYIVGNKAYSRFYLGNVAVGDKFALTHVTSSAMSASCTDADPTVCTAATHGLTTGDLVHSDSSTAPFNAGMYNVKVLTANTFNLMTVFSAGTQNVALDASAVGSATTIAALTIRGTGLSKGTKYAVSSVNNNDVDGMNEQSITASYGQATAVHGTGVLTSNGHGLVEDDVITFVITGTATDIQNHRLYRVNKIDANTFKLKTLTATDGTATPVTMSALKASETTAANLKFIKAPFVEFTDEHGGAAGADAAVPYTSEGSGVWMHPLQHDQPAEKMHLYTAWDQMYKAPSTGTTSFDGSSKSATALSTSTGVITVDTLGAVADLSKGLFAGDWIRVYDEATVGGYYCDCQVSAQPLTATSITCDAATMNSGYQFESMAGKCSDATGVTLALAHMSGARVITNAAATQWPIDEAAATHTVGSTETIGSLKVTWSAAFGAEQAAHLQPGAIAMLTGDSYAVICAGAVTTAPTVGGYTFEISAVAPTGHTSCQGLFATATLGVVVAQGQNAVYFNADDLFNADKFKDLAIGDRLRMSANDASTPGKDRTFLVDRMDSENAATRALFFRTGVAGGANAGRPTMYPIMALEGAYNGGKQAGQAAVTLESTTLLQHASTAGFKLAAPEVERVLEQLPNQVLSDVSVTCTSAGLNLYAFSVSFDAKGVSGNQNALVMNVDGCTTDGCQPRYKGVSTQVGVLADGDGHVTATGAASDGDGKGAFAYANEHGVQAGDTLQIFGATDADDKGNVYSVSSVFGSVAATDAALITLLSATQNDPAGGITAIARNPTPGNAVLYEASKLFKSVTYEITRGTQENTECSGRGNCNGEDGVCGCFSGYKGEACEEQEAQV